MGTAERMRADAVVVSEAHPLKLGQLRLRKKELISKGCPFNSRHWLLDWHLFPPERFAPAGATLRYHATGRMSGGVLVLVRRRSHAGDGVTATPLRSEASVVGDVSGISLHLTSPSRRSHAVVVLLGAYLLPASSSNTDKMRCVADTECDGVDVSRCWKQHPLLSLRRGLAVVDMELQQHPGATAAVVGDINAHLLGPTMRPGRHRERCVLGELGDAGFVVVNDFVDGRRPMGVKDRQVTVTHPTNANRSYAAATLDYCMVPSHQQDRVVHAKVLQRWPDKGLDHCPVILSLQPEWTDAKPTVGGTYAPSLEARETTVVQANDVIFDLRLLHHLSRPDVDQDAAAVLAPFAHCLDAVAAEVCGGGDDGGGGWGGGDGGGDGVGGGGGGGEALPAAPPHPNPAAAVESWMLAVQQAATQAGLARVRAMHSRHQQPDTDEGRLARLRRQRDRARRRVLAMEQDGVDGGQLEQLRTVHRDLARQATALATTLRREARVHAAVSRAARRHQSLAAATGATARATDSASAHRAISTALGGKSAVALDDTAARPSPLHINGAVSKRHAVGAWRARLLQLRRTNLDLRQNLPREVLDSYRAWEQGGDDGGGGGAANPLNRDFTAEEVLAAVVKQRRDAGLLGLPPAVLKAVLQPDGLLARHVQGYSAVPHLLHLTSILNGFLHSPRELVQCRELTQLALRPVYKRGDPTDPASFRLLTPGVAVAWLFYTAINTRLQGFLERQASGLGAGGWDMLGALPDAQSGFRPRRGCGELLLYAQEVATRAARDGKSVAQVYADRKAAFDRVQLPHLVASLRRLHIRGPMLRLLVAHLKSLVVRCSFGHHTHPLDECVSLEAGVYQGTPLAPTLYIVSAAGVAHTVNCDGVGADGMAFPPSAAVAHPSRWLDPRSRRMVSAAMASFADDDSVLLVHDDPRVLCQAVTAVVTELREDAVAYGGELHITDATKTAVDFWFNAGNNDRRAKWREWAVDRVPIPVTDQYKYLGVRREVAPRLRLQRGAGAGPGRLGAEVLVSKMRAALGVLVRAGMTAMSPTAARIAFSYASASALWGLEQWCLSVHDVPAAAEAAYVGCLRAIIGPGTHRAVGVQALHAACGVRPLWAVGLRQACTLIARVMALHPHHHLATALCQAAVGDDALGVPRVLPHSWFRVVVRLLREPGVRRRHAAAGAGSVILHDVVQRAALQDVEVWPAAAPRSRESLHQRVDDLVLAVWRQRWEEQPNRPALPPGLRRDTVGSGSSFRTARRWLCQAAPGVRFPLLDTRRRGVAFQLRVLALGGISLLIDGRNLRLVREAAACVMCGMDRDPLGFDPVSLLHVLGACPASHALRLECWRACEQYLFAGGGADGAPDGAMVASLDLAVRQPPHVAGVSEAVEDWVCLTLGVPTCRRTRPPVPGTTPRWCRLWYGPDAHGERVLSRRRAILSATAPLVHHLLEVRRVVSRLPGAHRVVKLAARPARALRGDAARV